MISCIFGWEDFFIEYQDQYQHVIRTITRRVIHEEIHISPDPIMVMDAFRACSLSNVKVVIMGQDPYPCGATGIALSISPGKILTPTLKVLSRWIGSAFADGDLTRWTKQGVLLINASLTIETGDDPIPHNIMWEAFIRGCVRTCSNKNHVAFLFLGTVASDFATSVSGDNLVLCRKHPAYYARKNLPVHKKRVFDKINNYLVNHGKKPIDFS